MQAEKQHRDELKHISSILARIHKNLMDDQMSLRELKAGETFSPNTKLQLLISDPEFEWLRVLSQLMTMVDDAIFQKDPLSEEQVTGLKNEVRRLLIAHTDKKFSTQYNKISMADPAMRLEHNRLLEFLKTPEKD